MDLSNIVAFVTSNQVSIIAALVVLQAITMLLFIWIWYKERRQQKRLRSMLNLSESAATLEASLCAHQSQVQELSQECQQLRRSLAQLETDQLRAIQHIGFYRYDAFPNVGGELSFSLALLDGQQQGFVITSIFGRQEARVYAKRIEDEHNVRLSQEEKEAVRRALAQK